MTRRERVEAHLNGIALTAVEELSLELLALYPVLDAARKVELSGILCDPGCCGDNCGCEDLRLALGRIR